MASPLSPIQLALAQAMSDLSERAFSAVWIDRLEFLLWHLLDSNSKKFGRIILTESEMNVLRVLSCECVGWIVFDDNDEESFVSISVWHQVYSGWLNSNSKPIEQ